MLLAKVIQKYRTYTVLSCLLFLLPIALIQGCSETQDPTRFLKIDISEQNQERIILETYSRLVFSETNFYNPTQLEVSEEGLFVLDISDDAITRRYSWDFELINSIG